MVFKKCDVCGEKFETKTNTKRCSDTCRKQAYNEYHANWRAKNRQKLLEIRNRYTEKNGGDIKKRQSEWYQENREELVKRQNKYNHENREAVNERVAKWKKENPDKVNLQRIKDTKSLLKRNPRLTPKNRRKWGGMQKLMESVAVGLNYNGTHHAHHILPIALYPNLALEIWNGVVLPADWHHEFHRDNNIHNYLLDWPGLLFDFIDSKIHEHGGEQL